MAALNFQHQFLPKVLDGSKPGTIRQKRKRPIKVGELLYIYTDQRSKKAKKHATKVCYGLIDIRITEDSIYVEGVALYEAMKEGFAKLDGFANYADFLAFFRKQYGLPFSGDWIVWSSKHVEGVKEYIKQNSKRKRKS